MATEGLKEEKQRIRSDMRKRRRNLSAEQMSIWSEQIADYFCAWSIYHKCETVMFYLAMPDEVQTDLLIKDALKRGKRVCVPLLGEKDGEMAAAMIANLDDLVVGKYGLRMPDPYRSKLILPASIQMVVVPAVAFDWDGNRLGLGAGYYDRFLPEAINSVFIGMAWECQLTGKLPNEEHDVQMQYVLTEKSCISCNPCSIHNNN